MASIAEDIRAAAASLSSSTPEPSGTTGTNTVGTTDGTPAAPKAVPEPTGTSGTTTGRDAQGRFAPKQGDKPVSEPAPVPPKTATEGTPAPAAPARKGPPPSFRPTVHGHWERVPPEVQDEIWRLEQSTRHLVQNSAQHRKRAERLDQLLGGYKPYIQGDEFDWLGSLAQTAVRLQTAPKRDRAAVLAQMARQFDVDVNDLDDALSAVLSGQAVPQQAPQQRHSEAPHPLETKVQALEQQLQHMSLAPMVEAFTREAEFLDEPMPGREDLRVRDMVAHHLRVAAHSGIALTPQEAYAQVIATHPTVQAVMRQRDESKAATERQAQTARAEAASRSVRTEPVVATPSTGSKGRTLDDVRASAKMLLNRS